MVVAVPSDDKRLEAPAANGARKRAAHKSTLHPWGGARARYLEHRDLKSPRDITPILTSGASVARRGRYSPFAASGFFNCSFQLA
ncbi:MAG TPA: hypothetical protein VK477_08785, partial [Acidobacteriota bacterium]|nr:hypothetical protein [Acidobacteriota bacterium]